MQSPEIYEAVKLAQSTIRPGTVNLNDLAQAMLDWRRIKGDLDFAEAAIRREVLRLGETVTTGTVRATYNKGRKSYGYASAATASYDPDNDAHAAALAKHTVHPPPKTNWRLVCVDAEFTDIPFTQAEPSVTIKILE